MSLFEWVFAAHLSFQSQHWSAYLPHNSDNFFVISEVAHKNNNKQNLCDERMLTKKKGLLHAFESRIECTKTKVTCNHTETETETGTIGWWTKSKLCVCSALVSVGHCCDNALISITYSKKHRRPTNHRCSFFMISLCGLLVQHFSTWPNNAMQTNVKQIWISLI